MSHEVSQVGSEGSKHASNQASNAGTTPQFRAAQYVRMSTEHQQHSTHNPKATTKRIGSKSAPTAVAFKSCAPTPMKAKVACQLLGVPHCKS